MMINGRKIAWQAAALAVCLPLAVFVSMIIGVQASAHDSGMGFIVGTFIGVLLIRGIALASEKVLQRWGVTRTAAFLVGVLVVGGAMWALARSGG